MTTCQDQYSDGAAASVWQNYIGTTNERTDKYKNWLCGILRAHKCQRILDVACGTGVDSEMLIEEGFHVTSIDASDQMLKHAISKRWKRRHHKNFENWEIEEGNWLTLPNDMKKKEVQIGVGFDAVICLGNSFAHLLSDEDGDTTNQKLALKNFERLVKPNKGILIIDHRNYDAILRDGRVPEKNVYYNSDCIDKIRTTQKIVDGIPLEIKLDYVLFTKEQDTMKEEKEQEALSITRQHRFSLSYYPHKLNDFRCKLFDVFGRGHITHEVYADFKPLNAVTNPAYYVHIVQKTIPYMWKQPSIFMNV